MNVVNSEVVIDKLDDLEDVVIADLQDGQVLQYDETYKVWGNVTLQSAEEMRF